METIQEQFLARIKKANLTLKGYSDDYVVVQIPLQSRYVFFRLPYQSRTVYNEIRTTKDGHEFILKQYKYVLKDEHSPIAKDDRTGEIFYKKSYITIPKQYIFCGVGHADLIMIDLKDEYQKYYLERLSKDYVLKYPKMMRLFFKGFKYEIPKTKSEPVTCSQRLSEAFMECGDVDE